MDRFGRELGIVGNLGIGGCIDTVMEGSRLYIIGSEKYRDTDTVDLEEGYNSGHMYIADISDPAKPRLTGVIHGLGNTRKLKVESGIAYVASREDGLFIIDANNLSDIRIVSHFDTIDFANGIDISGTYAFVACRFFGVQIIDIKNILCPAHVGIIRVGEAQSVHVHDGFLYVGIWGQRELVVCDVRRPENPSVIARMPVDGRSDGVFVKGKYCYVATGHHARGMISEEPSDPAFGKGNGLEIFDITAPENPVFVSRIKINRFYKLFNNLWSVTVSGRFALLAHSYNGVFIINVSDPASPEFAAHIGLPDNIGNNDSYNNDNNNDNSNIGGNNDKVSYGGLQSPVGGIAAANGLIYVTGICSDLYIVKAPGIAESLEPDNINVNKGNYAGGTDSSLIRKPSGTGSEKDLCYTVPRLSSRNNCDSPMIRFRLYKPGTQVYSAAIGDGFTVAACGKGGIHVIEERGSGSAILRAAEYATKGFSMDVKISGSLIYVAEGNGGLSIWRMNGVGGQLETIGYYNAYGSSVKQVVITLPPEGSDSCSKYALLHVGSKWLHIIDVSDPEYPRLVMADSQEKGLLYGRQICDGLMGGRYAGCFWHIAGMYWYDIYGRPQPCFSGYCLEHRLSGIADGIAYTGDGAVLIYRHGYVLIDQTSMENPDDLPRYTVKGCSISGKPSIYGNTMFVANRADGDVIVIDISDLKKPALISNFRIEGNPDIITMRDRKVVIPAGYQGLLMADYEDISG